MERKCNHCGATVVGSHTTCPSCGNPIAEKSCNFLNGEYNVYALAAAVLALLICLLSLITAFSDSSTIINRMYTTALEWNIPLITIVLTVVGFAVAQKECKSALLSLVATGLLAVGFVFSNTTKNLVQDHISNADNYVSVASEAVRDNAPSIVGWVETMEQSVKDVEKGLEKDFQRYQERKMKEAERERKKKNRP
jgi:amino acid permease